MGNGITAFLKQFIKNDKGEQKDVYKRQAKDIMIKSDKKRSSYYNYYSNKKWGCLLYTSRCV